MSKGYAAQDRGVPPTLMAGLLMLSAIVIILSYSAYDAGVMPVATPRATQTPRILTVVAFVEVTVTPTPEPTLASWWLTATAAPTATRGPLQTATPTFAPTSTFNRADRQETR